MKQRLTFTLTLLLLSGTAVAVDCKDLPTETDLKAHMKEIGQHNNGGLFNGTLLWAAVVNRAGELCAFTTSTDDPRKVWPGAQAVAKSKAYTANAVSNDSLPLSTARLYTFTQPGHTMWGLGESNSYNPNFLSSPEGAPGGTSKINGGMIFFGGGVPLYKNDKVIGGLGISGDTPCTDHEVAKGVRELAELNPSGGTSIDDIWYSSVDGASVFTHPLCINTFRNGEFIGTELPATDY